MDLRVLQSRTRLLVLGCAMMAAALLAIASVALADTFRGTDGPDKLVGTNGNDYMDSGRGNDNLEGRRGQDRMIGGFGNDYVNGGFGRDRLDGGAGADRVYGGAGNDPVVDGGSGSDPLVTGGSGNDYVTGYTGNDRVYGYTGDDEVVGGKGNDEMYGGDDNDTLTGDTGKDDIDGGEGADEAEGGLGDDNIEGGVGNDRLFGGNPEQTVRDNGGDTINGQAGNDLVAGGFGADELRGGGGNDKIIEGPWKDQSVDRIYGGTGDDLISSDNDPGQKDIVSCGPGNDRVYADDVDEVSEDCEKVVIFQDTQREAQAQLQAQQGDFTTQQVVDGFFDCAIPGYFRGSNYCTTTDIIVGGDRLGIGANVITNVETARFKAQGAFGGPYSGSFFGDANLQDSTAPGGTSFAVVWEAPPLLRDTRADIRGEAQSFRSGYAAGYYTID